MPGYLVSIFLTSLLILCSGSVSGQTYPSKPIRIITIGVGGGLDNAARLIAQELSVSLGSVIVENRGGAGGAISIETAAKAAPDGYTLLVQGSSLWFLPFMRDTATWDPVKDFTPITLVGSAPNILVVHPSLPVKSVKDLTNLAKAKPGQLNFSSTGAGAVTHLAGELFKAMAGVTMVHVPYRAGGLALSALISGEVEIMFPSASTAAPHIKFGRLRALALTSAQPSVLLPGLPTVAASGLPGYECTSMYGVWAPANTPSTIVARLNQEIVRALNKPQVKKQFLAYGVETVGSSPEEFAKTIKTDMAVLGKVIKNARIRVE
jgi:tripartite-type tricarboxylate transporter receptor subunit TctC